MTELALYRFIEETESEIEWRKDELIIWIHLMDILKFIKLIHAFMSSGGFEVSLQSTCIALDLVEICDYFDIDPESILKKDD